MKLKINRKIGLTIFIVLTMFFVIQNPMFVPLNIYVQSSQLTVNNPNINNGLSIQGSFLVNYDVKNIQALNGNQTVDAFQVDTTIFNFMSLVFLLLPIVIYMYFEDIPISINVVKKERVK